MQGLLQEIVNEVKKVIIGKDEILKKVIMAVVAKGHILIDDIPGVGKTTMAMAFSKAMGCRSNRLQFTPDVMPSDIMGFNVFNAKTQDFEYRQGAAMCNILLADEINRTSSKTHSALLEVMEEHRVSVDGVTRPVPDPFVVIATQNPVGSIGTQLLPESQLDRFMIRLSMGYPVPEQEIRLIKEREKGNPLDIVNRLTDEAGVLKLMEQVDDIFAHDAICEYIVALVNATRNHPLVELGVSPRGTLALVKMAKACALYNGRDYCTPDDVKYVLYDVVGHRLKLSYKAGIDKITEEDIVNEILKQVEVPRAKKRV